MKKFFKMLLAVMMIAVLFLIPTVALADAGGATQTQTIAWVVAAAEAVVVLVMGFAVSYFKTSAKFRGFIAKLIADAEVEYANVKKAGKIKMRWVVEQLYKFIPAPFNLIFSEEQLEAFVQDVFDKITQYATIQCDKAVDALQAKYDAARADASNKAITQKK